MRIGETFIQGLAVLIPFGVFIRFCCMASHGARGEGLQFILRTNLFRPNCCTAHIPPFNPLPRCRCTPPSPPDLQTTFFTEEDIDAMFSLFDPTGRGHISHEQYDNGEWNSVQRHLAIVVGTECPIFNKG